jgi:NAD(P)-dependent dehydrogenase (short-subunit alcohol dehydrogenase family)
MQLEGKRIIVTGGARGIGGSAVRAFAREGADVASLDVLDELGEKVASEASADGPGTVRYHTCDVGRRDDVKRVFAESISELGGLDALVHIAGIHREAPPESITDEDWDLVLRINLTGTFVTNQEAFPYLRDNGGGRIVNFGSSAGQVPYVMAGHYSAAKGGVLSWTRTIAHAWGKHGITANAVTPAIMTPMAAEVGERLMSSMSVEEMEAMGRMTSGPPTALGGMGDPDADMAPVLVFLVSEAARFITAQIIAVDGGLAPVR